MAVRSPIFIDRPRGWQAVVVNSTASVEFIVPDTGEYIRVENMTVVNSHTSDVTVELIRDDGSTEVVIWEKELSAGQYVDVLADRIAEAIKQFTLLQWGHSYRVRCQSAVAGEVGWEANGGCYTTITA